MGAGAAMKTCGLTSLQIIETACLMPNAGHSDLAAFAFDNMDWRQKGILVRKAG